MITKNTEEAIIQNLKDAGCEDECINKIMNDIKCGKTTAGINTLCKHRKILLENLHYNQKCIDCLDYLVYQIERENENEKNKDK